MNNKQKRKAVNIAGLRGLHNPVIDKEKRKSFGEKGMSPYKKHGDLEAKAKNLVAMWLLMTVNMHLYYLCRLFIIYMDSTKFKCSLNN